MRTRAGELWCDGITSRGGVCNRNAVVRIEWAENPSMLPGQGRWSGAVACHTHTAQQVIKAFSLAVNGDVHVLNVDSTWDWASGTDTNEQAAGRHG